MKSGRIAAEATFALLLLCLAGSNGCGGDGAGVCDAAVYYGIQVAVRDAATGSPAAAGAIGWAIENSYSDSLEVACWSISLEPSCLSGALERPGTYTVLVYKPGYQAWSKSGVIVTADECGVVTTTLVADLEKVASFQ